MVFHKIHYTIMSFKTTYSAKHSLINSRTIIYKLGTLTILLEFCPFRLCQTWQKHSLRSPQGRYLLMDRKKAALATSLACMVSYNEVYR